MVQKTVKNIISLFKLLREGISFKRLSHPLHIGRSTVQECRLVIQSPHGLKEGAKWPITDALYTYLRPLSIRPMETPSGKQWCILLPPSRSLYRVKQFDHIRRRIVVERVKHLQLFDDYVPYKCYRDSHFLYGEDGKMWRACTPELVTYVTFNMLPEINKPLLYLRYKQVGHNIQVLNLIFISRPRRNLKSIPVVCTYDLRFIWIGATIDDLRNCLKFKELPTNYEIEIEGEGGGRVPSIMQFYKGVNTRYSYEDLLEGRSVVRTIRSYALVKVYLETSEEPHSSSQLIKNENLGLSIYRLSRLCFKKVLRGSWLRSNTNMTTTAPIFIDIYACQGVGVRVVNSEGIELLFEKKAFRKLVEGIVLSNIRLLKTLLLKYILLNCCYNKEEKYYDLRAIADNILTLIQGGPDEKLSKALYARDVDDIIAVLKRDSRYYEKFIDYVVEAALYSLAHILAKAIITHVLNTRLENFTIYVNTKDEHYVIMFLENSHEGLGFVEQLCKLFNQFSDVRKGIVEYLVKPALLMLVDERSGKDLCSKAYEDYRRINASLVDTLCQSSPELNQVREYISGLMREWHKRIGIEFPSDFIRFIIYYYLRSVNYPLLKKINSDAFMRNTLPYIYNIEVPFCWDGCQQCVRLKDIYSLPPIDQIFYLSKDLAIRLLKTISSSLIHNREFMHRMGKGLGREILSLLSQARRETRIISPWISPETVRFIVNIAQSRGVKVKLITRPPGRNEPSTHIRAIRILERATKSLRIIKVAYNEKAHTKTIIIDDELMITGSMNLTRYGIEDNIENLTISHDKATIYRTITEYESIWWASLGKTKQEE